MGKKKSQKDAVFEIVLKVLGNLYSPNRPMRPYFNNQRRNLAVEIFVEKVNSGEISRPKNCEWDHELKTYAKRIVIDRLNRDRRLNGDVRYVPKRYSIEKTINSDRVISELRREIHEIQTKGISRGWGRSKSIIKVLKEDFELTKHDKKQIKNLEKKINDRKQVLNGYGNHLPEVSRCLNNPQTMAYIGLLTSVNNKSDCTLIIEALIHHILTYTEPIETSKEEKNAS